MDPEDSKEINGVLARIEVHDLPHPSGALLSSFIHEALDPVEAARYVDARLLAGESRSLVLDWTYIVESVCGGTPPPPPDAKTQQAIKRRDGNRCCITGKAGTLRDPLLVVPVLPVPAGWLTDKPEISEMLGAFFGPPYRDWWLTYTRTPGRLPSFLNHWTVRRSAANAFARGLARLDRRQPSMIEYELSPVQIGPEEPLHVDGSFPLLGDHSRSGTLTVDPRFVGSQARLSRSIRYLEVAKEIAPGILSRQPSDPETIGSSNPPTARKAKLPSAWGRYFEPLVNFPVRAILFTLRLFPTGVRVAAYGLLRRLGEAMYAKSSALGVQRLPFGLYLKLSSDIDMARNEANALQQVRRHTSIPVPKPLDVFLHNDRSHILMTRVPGVPLWHCQDVFSDADYAELAAQMKDYLAQLRAVPKSVNPDAAICNTLGGPVREHRIRWADPIGPFADEAAFSQNLRFSDEPARRGHRVVFTHADLNPRNILVEQVARRDGSCGWRVSGIVDWETAGYYPEYWDYTKALFEGFRWSERYKRFVKTVFAEFGDYSAELDVETRAWESGDAV